MLYTIGLHNLLSTYSTRMISCPTLPGLTLHRMHFLNCYPKRPGTTISRLLRGQDTGVRTWDVDLKWLKLAAWIMHIAVFSNKNCATRLEKMHLRGPRDALELPDYRVSELWLVLVEVVCV